MSLIEPVAKFVSKEVLDTALRFAKDGMPFGEAVRAGHAIMGEPLHPQTARLLALDARVGRTSPDFGLAQWQDNLKMQRLNEGGLDTAVARVRETPMFSHNPMPALNARRAAAGLHSRNYVLQQLINAAAAGDEVAKQELIQAGGLNWMMNNLG